MAKFVSSYGRLLFLACILAIISGLPMQALGGNTRIHYNFNSLISPEIHPVVPEAGDISSDGQSSGIGQSLNLTHNASRTDAGVPMSLNNGTWDSYNMPLAENWVGNSLQANVTSLVDERNWINGTFAWDAKDDGSYNQTENDTLEIRNPFQNWTFQANDAFHEPGYFINNMSGNYYNSTNPKTLRNALELRIEGNINDSAGDGYGPGVGYDEGDYCQWTTNFQVPRGGAQDARLHFFVNPYHTMQMSFFEFQVLIDGINVYSISTAILNRSGSGWQDYTIPMNVWINTTNVFPAQMDGVTQNITLRLEYTSAWGVQYDFPNRDFQQIFIAGPELYIEAEVKPEQINLTMNGVPVTSNQFGWGNAIQYSNWPGSSATGNFTVTNNASFNVDYLTNLTFSAEKNIPTTNYAPNSESVGTFFTAQNNSNVLWDFYSYVSVPPGYNENNLTIFFPADWTATWVSAPTDSGTNLIGSCMSAIPGQVSVPIDVLTTVADGFWLVQATAPNYATNVFTMRNGTNGPSPTSWVLNNTFFAGDYINISAQLATGGAFSIASITTAFLNIQFPNGSFWDIQAQSVNTHSDGSVCFAPFQIPLSGPDYVAGTYNILISWDNSLGLCAANESGVYQTTVTIKHLSQLIVKSTPTSNFMEGTNATIELQFVDNLTGQAIQGATIQFTNLDHETEYFTEYEPGYYIAEIDAPSDAIGQNTLNITATHPAFDSQLVSVSVVVMPKPWAGIPLWLLYILVGILAFIMVALVSYQKYFKYPKLVRDLRVIKRRIGQGQVTPMPVKTEITLFGERYISEVKHESARGVNIEPVVKTCQQRMLAPHISRPTPVVPEAPQAPQEATPASEMPDVALGVMQEEFSSQRVRLDQIKQKLTQVEELKDKAAENETLQEEYNSLTERIKAIEPGAVPSEKLREQIQKLENQLTIQKKQVQQLQQINEQLQTLQAQVSKIPELEQGIQSLEGKLAAFQATVTPPEEATTGDNQPAVPPTPAQLVQQLQQKVYQCQVAIRSRDAQIKDIEDQLDKLSK